MKTDTTLCVVDMQPCFKAHEQALLLVLKEINEAKKRGDAVVVLEYTKRFHKKFHTAKPIVDALKSHKHKVVYVEKCDDDGSTEFLVVANRFKFSTEIVRVVGVNRGQCIFATVDGLSYSQRVKRVEVVLNATWGKEPEAEAKLLEKLVKDCPEKIAIV